MSVYQNWIIGPGDEVMLTVNEFGAASPKKLTVTRWYDQRSREIDMSVMATAKSIVTAFVRSIIKGEIIPGEFEEEMVDWVRANI